MTDLDNEQLEKIPFRKYNLEETKRDIFSVSLSKQERAWLEECKEDLNIKADSVALKEMAWIGRNVLQHTFSRETLKYLFKKDRVRLEDFK